MGNLGLGVMINMLGGNEDTIKTLEESKDKTITKLSIDEDYLMFCFSDNSKMRMFDDGQSCCESRYINTDDNLNDFVGSKFIEAGIKAAPEIECEYGTHEVQFLVIKTSIGEFTLETHNEHNGYYGGFWMVAESIT